MASALACTNGTVGSYTCVQAAANSGFSITDVNAVFSSNVTSGNIVIVHFTGPATATLTFTMTSCTGVTMNTPNAQINTANLPMLHGWGSAGSTAACTIIGHSTVSGALEIAAVEMSVSGGFAGSPNDGSNAVCVSSDCATQVTAAATITAGSVTTAANGDLVTADFSEGSQSGVYTATGGAVILISGGFDTMIQGQVQTSAGVIAPTATNTATAVHLVGTFAFKKASGKPANQFPRAY
jgi:hypothetical protein